MAKKKKSSGKKRKSGKKSKGPTTKGGFPLHLFKTNLNRMISTAKENGIAVVGHSGGK